MTLSADGDFLGVGGVGDDRYIGATWVYQYNGSDYIQVGEKIVGTGFINNSRQGKENS